MELETAKRKAGWYPNEQIQQHNPGLNPVHEEVDKPKKSSRTRNPPMAAEATQDNSREILRR
jgi:hypothetical protein